MQVFEDMAELSSSSSYCLKDMSALAELIIRKKITNVFISPKLQNLYNIWASLKKYHVHYVIQTNKKNKSLCACDMEEDSLQESA